MEHKDCSENVQNTIWNKQAWGRRHRQCTAVSLVMLAGEVRDASDYCKLGIQERLFISDGVRVESGRCANDARRILHFTPANFTPVASRPSCVTDRRPTLFENYRTTNVITNKSDSNRFKIWIEISDKTIVMGSDDNNRASVENVRWPKL